MCFPCNGNKRNIVTELPDGTPLAHSLLFSVSFWYARAFTLFPESHGGSHILVSILGDKAWVNRAKEMYYSFLLLYYPGLTPRYEFQYIEIGLLGKQTSSGRPQLPGGGS